MSRGFNPSGNDSGPLPPHWGSLGRSQAPPAAPQPQPYYYYPHIPGSWVYNTPAPAAPAPAPAPQAYCIWNGYNYYSSPPQICPPPPVQPTTITRNASGWNDFPQAKAPIVFIRSGAIRPWTQEFVAHSTNPYNNVTIRPTNIPVNTTVKELLEKSGATNEDPEKNVVVEVFRQGNGRWKKGVCIHAGEDRADMKIGDLGWDETRKGDLNGDFTYLFVSADTKCAELRAS